MLHIPAKAKVARLLSCDCTVQRDVLRSGDLAASFSLKVLSEVFHWLSD
jgi:hypothetical protein